MWHLMWTIKLKNENPQEKQAGPTSGCDRLKPERSEPHRDSYKVGLQSPAEHSQD